MIEVTKLEELSSKTDRQLAQLASNELDFGTRAALEALTSAGNPPSADKSYAAARAALQEAGRVMALLGQKQDRNLESRRERLGKMLETFLAIGSAASPSEAAVADLARVMWEARGCPEGVPEDDWFRAENALKSRAGVLAACGGR
jgi:hypothetical protein